MSNEKKFNWYGRSFDGTEQESDRVLNDQNTFEYEFANLSIGFAVRINGILLVPGAVFRESYQLGEKTEGEYRFEWVEWGAGATYFTNGYGRAYKLFSVREKRPVGRQQK